MAPIPVGLYKSAQWPPPQSPPRGAFLTTPPQHRPSLTQIGPLQGIECCLCHAHLTPLPHSIFTNILTGKNNSLYLPDEELGTQGLSTWSAVTPLA